MQPPFVVLDFPASPSRGLGTLVFERPVRVLSAVSVDEVAGVLREADGEAARGRHAVGFVAYEAAPAFDTAFSAHPGGAVPLAWFGVFDAPTHDGAADDGSSATAAWHERSRPGEYADAIERIHAAIGRGDVYQVNFTVRLDVDVDGDTAALYRRLLLAQGPGYGAHIHTGRHEIISASPELFFERRGTHIVTRPMKGTARRGRWLDEDDRRAGALASSEKERAENVMIVDLLRNDLGRIAETGTVRVTKLFDVERRPTVLQMTSTIEASLRAGTSNAEIFGALFPCGSVTGAPKIAAASLIASLESTERGVYCGAIGHIAPRGESTFSVAIRTLTFDHARRRAEYGVGSGITWDSARAAEYDEVVAKAAILTADLPTFDLLETLRLERGEYARLDRHLARLEGSAAYFGFASPRSLRDAAERALRGHAASAGQAPERVRVTVSPAGATRVDAAPLPEIQRDGAAPVSVALAATPVKRHNRFLYHKTTHRTVYDRHRAEHPGAFDVLLWNEDGELTEFTIGNLVVELDGARWTPPRECGLLGGVFREELLERGEIHERVLRADDLARATAIWLINSLREWVSIQSVH
ncbi:MAG TPA: aminodeoxychorismate synthase component I [Gemmatimonadaceae bacterium]|nr:aminodeoxychorismate synthase component I [Gemmatimonadaceae bacterium]